jgi:S-DNA-T family DNA segregation ATPase FtsK/SpoIIIE
MRKFLKSLEKSCQTAKKINYKNMSKEEQIKTKLSEHGMILHFVDKIEGLNIDLYRFEPSIGLKMKKIEGYVADIEQVVGKSGVRVLAPIPNTTYVGFEVPRADRKFIDEAPVNNGFELAFGKDVMGDIFKYDLRKAPHLLVAGATGSGKSVFLNSIISQLSKLEKIQLHLFDPKMVELALFKKEKRVVEYKDDIMEIHDSLKWFVKKMNERYKILAESGVRNIEEYNKSGGNMKYKFLIIDEFGDLIISNHVKEETVETGETFKDGRAKMKIEKTNISKEIEKYILILAQKARACGIHLIIATQRPSVDIITGSIKANFPCKVAFRTAKAIDSQVLLGESGAEKLQGKGDMIFSSDEGNIRLQGYNF